MRVEIFSGMDVGGLPQTITSIYWQKCFSRLTKTLYFTRYANNYHVVYVKKKKVKEIINNNWSYYRDGKEENNKHWLVTNMYYYKPKRR